MAANGSPMRAASGKLPQGPATEDEIDELIKCLELKTERQVATAGSAVKGVAAERDLLDTAAQARDLLNVSVAGEKESLDRIFGGSCERIGRLRIALDRVSISDMHAKDLRWGHLRSVVATIESVLKDLGTFKPWAPPSVRAPERIAYRGVRRRLSPGRRVNWRPDIEGGDVQSFEVVPPLPVGMELAATTGLIFGAPSQSLVDETAYTVTGRNAGGEAQAELVFGVREAPPQAVGYPAHGERCQVVQGEELSMSPSVQGNTPLTWRVSPSLPDGLDLDANSGLISGAATVATESREYEIVASNAGGETRTVLNLEVLMTPPTALAYPGVHSQFFAGRDIELAPTVHGKPTGWSVEPALPEGLLLDPASGVIRGAPTAVSAHRSWSVAATNAAGSASCEIAFAVDMAPPEALEYAAADLELQLLHPASVRPRFQGLVDSFSVAPDLPAGLALDTSVGEIGGAPTELVDGASFEITARNASGCATTSVTVVVRMAAPSELQYPQLDPYYTLGENVKIEASVAGCPASRFTVDPALPSGLALNGTTGEIEGVPCAEAGETNYVVTAANEAGAVSAEVAFAIVAPAPADLSYPSASSSYAVGEPVAVEPQGEDVAQAWQGTFHVQPALPSGLVLDAATGVISGTPAEVCPLATYSVVLTTSGGQTSANLDFEIIETVQCEAVAESIDKHLAAKIEAVTDIEDIVPEPSRVKAFGDWMIWMVHRAHLDDPALVEFNFNNMHMPPPHVEARIAPKLVKAMSTNTHIEVLSLVNSNLMKTQGIELAAALKDNSTVRTLNLEGNELDSNAIREIAESIRQNSESAVEHLRLSPQKQVGQFFGRPVEEAVGALMDKNSTIIKLGFECNDAHWRNLIDRALLRNNDIQRRMRKRMNRGRRLGAAGMSGDSYDDGEDGPPPEERALSRLTLRVPPEAASSQVFVDNSPPHLAFRGFVAQQKRLPNATQLQSKARSDGLSLKYSEVAPTLKECRARMLDAAVGTGVTVADIFEVDTQGTLLSWSSTNDNWVLNVRADDDGRRYAYKSSKELVLLVSDAWGAWLQAEKS